MPRLRPVRDQNLENQPNEPVILGSSANYGGEDDRPALFESQDGGSVEKTEKPDKPQKVEKEDASSTLQKQLDELRKSERLAQERAEQAIRERAEAIRTLNEREEEAHRLKKEGTDTRLTAINAGIAAANAEAEAAQREIDNAISIGDTKAQSDAYRRLAKAEANLARMEEGKLAVEQELKQLPEKPQQHQQPTDRLDNTNLPDNAKSWLRAHPEYLSSPRKNAQIQSLHWVLVEDEKHEPFSKEYFESMEVHLGLKEKPEKAEENEEFEDEEEEPEVRTDRKKSGNYSAPVSREVPMSSRRQVNPSDIRLTKAQVEAAKLSGITPAEYAKQMAKLGQLKDDGHYGDKR